ncbi:MAG: NAD(P)-binding domain-containing protein [Gemmatimonas sp.]
MIRADETDIAIIGAGPYGLSLAAHLRELRIAYRIFGIPLESWRTKMPKGMHLKSHGFASNLYDPNDAYTLERYCEESGLPYDPYVLPVPVETFCEYGLAFQQAFVPDLDRRMVEQVVPSSTGYLLTLEDGAHVHARKVVCAIGITHFDYVPAVLRSMPRDIVTHASQHHDLDRFKGRDVTIVGGGASAVDLAALLHETGARVRVVTRRRWIPFGSMVRTPRTLWDEIRAPTSPLGPGWRSRLCTDAPLLFHVMPARFRVEVVRRHLGPAGGWFMRDRVEVSAIRIVTDADLVSAMPKGSGVQLRIRLRQDGAEHSLTSDHVIAATGYEVDLARLAFLTPLTSRMRQVANTPVLTSTFESSAPGLYFIGVTAANSFGPMLRFACGARFAARRLSRHLAGLSRATPARRPSPFVHRAFPAAPTRR